nr:uncharacterized protein LOC128702359 isoform X1 [Cherax quadricarinatus]
MLRMLTCDKCKEAFNHLKKIPKSLHCGHTCCTECAQQLLNNSEISCPFCKKKTYNVRCARNLACNQSILKLIPKITDKAIVTVSRTDSPVNQLNVSKVSLMGEHYEKPVMTRDKKQSMQFPRQNDSRREFNIMSPHNSQCLGAGVDPSAYCTKCQQWICDVCRKVDHHETRGCILNPLKETITKMKQKHENNSSSACETLNGSVKELKSYCDQLDGLLLSMRAAFECIGAEHEDLKKAVQEGTQMERNLKDLVLKSQSSRNLSETLANFKDIENCCVTSQEWMSNVMSQVSGSNTVKKVAKDLICMTLKSLRTSASENGEVNQIVACHESTTTRFSVLTVEGGRIHLHCLTSSTPGQATQKLPLECFTSCMNTTSSLVFINLSWGGSTRGRVYIRLTGDTVRGRQFLKLCTGEMGPSFCNTNFHRVWWKGYPGESIWGGDFEHGDGSGEVTFTSGLDSEQTTALSRSVPIIAGLVAGRYEKKNTSSIFRIYTMDSKNCVEEAAFGQVEFGLDVIQNAVKHSNISDVVISDCGIVMEF